MSDVAQLSIKVDSSDVPKAASAMDQMAGSGAKLESGMESLAYKALVLVASFEALEKASGFLLASTRQAAQYEMLGGTLAVVGNNAGYTCSQMEAFDKKLQATGISMIGSRQELTRMAAANMDLSKSADLARMAQDAGRIANINSTEAFGHLIHGIQSGRTEVLRTLGINVDFERGYENLANQLGKTEANLTEVEKSHARLNTVLEAGASRAGVYETAMGTAGGELLSMQRHVENLETTIGEPFLPAFAYGIHAVTEELKAEKEWLDKNSDSVMSLKINCLGISQNLVGMASDLAGIGPDVNNIAEGVSAWEVSAFTVNAVFGLVRDTLNVVVGTIATITSGLGILVTGPLAGIEKIYNKITGSKSDWAGNAFNQSMNNSLDAQDLVASPFMGQGGTQQAFTGQNAIDAIFKQQEAIKKATQGTEQQRIEASKAAKALQEKAAADAAAADAAKGHADEVQNFINKIKDEIATYGMSQTQKEAVEAKSLGLGGNKQVQTLLNMKQGWEDYTKARKDVVAADDAAEKSELAWQSGVNSLMDTLDPATAMQERFTKAQWDLWHALDQNIIGLDRYNKLMQAVKATMTPEGIAATKAEDDDQKSLKHLQGKADNLNKQYAPDDDSLQALADLKKMQNAGKLLEGVYGQAFMAIKRQGSGAFAYLGQLSDGLANGIGDAFYKMTMGVTVHFKDMFASIAADLARMAAQKGFMQLLGLAWGAMGRSTNSAVFSSSFPSSLPAGPDLSGLLVPPKASGGSVSGGSTYLVGEVGPELFVPSHSGTIIPNHALGSGKSGDTVNIQIIHHDNGGASTTTSGNSAKYDVLAKQVHGIVLETLHKEKRLGNSMNPLFGRA